MFRDHVQDPVAVYHHLLVICQDERERAVYLDKLKSTNSGYLLAHVLLIAKQRLADARNAFYEQDMLLAEDYPQNFDEDSIAMVGKQRNLLRASSNVPTLVAIRDLVERKVGRVDQKIILGEEACRAALLDQHDILFQADKIEASQLYEKILEKYQRVTNPAPVIHGL